MFTLMCTLGLCTLGLCTLGLGGDDDYNWKRMNLLAILLLVIMGSMVTSEDTVIRPNFGVVFQKMAHHDINVNFWHHTIAFLRPNTTLDNYVEINNGLKTIFNTLPNESDFCNELKPNLEMISSLRTKMNFILQSETDTLTHLLTTSSPTRGVII